MSRAWRMDDGEVDVFLRSPRFYMDLTSLRGPPFIEERLYDQHDVFASTYSQLCFVATASRSSFWDAVLLSGDKAQSIWCGSRRQYYRIIALPGRLAGDEVTKKLLIGFGYTRYPLSNLSKDYQSWIVSYLRLSNCEGEFSHSKTVAQRTFREFEQHRFCDLASGFISGNLLLGKPPVR